MSFYHYFFGGNNNPITKKITPINPIKILDAKRNTFVGKNSSEAINIEQRINNRAELRTKIFFFFVFL